MLPIPGYHNQRGWSYTDRAAGLARVNCPCGNAPEFRPAEGLPVTCACGTTYDHHGWILDLPRTYPTRAELDQLYLARYIDSLLDTE